MKDHLLRVTRKRNDEWASEVAGRLQHINDLVAAEAAYHLRCKTNFERLSSRQNTLEQCSKPTMSDKEESFVTLCEWLESQLENGVLTLEEVYHKQISLDNNSIYCKKWLKQKLLVKYAEKLHFVSEDGKKDILCFTDVTNTILRDYQKKKESTKDEKNLIIETAAQLIQNDIKLLKLDPKYYPTIEQMTNVEYQLSFLPQSIKTLLKHLVKTDERTAAWGNALILVAYWSGKCRCGFCPFIHST